MLPSRERGDAGLGPVGAVAVTIVVIALVRIVFGVDLIGYLDAAVDWCVDLFRNFIG